MRIRTCHDLCIQHHMAHSRDLYRKEQLADYDFLIKHFYSVHTSTTAGRDLMKSDKFLSEDFTLEGANDKPQILIYHTHSQEEFADHGPDNPGATVVGIGNYLTELLTAKGYNVIHDTSVYDLQNGKLDRNKAYTYALDGITGILQKNPSIEVILDVHRDGVNENLHMVNQVNGKPTAPIMFFLMESARRQRGLLNIFPILIETRILPSAFRCSLMRRPIFLI